MVKAVEDEWRNFGTTDHRADHARGGARLALRNLSKLIPHASVWAVGVL